MPKKYNIRQSEERGRNPEFYEPRIVFWFWKEHNMDDAITWSAEELNAKVEAFMDAYQERQLASDIHWWYPESPRLQKKRPKGY